jgi:diguanylate cyclase (GGDEF)-like protein
MNLFPVGVDGEITAAIAILNPIGDDNTKKQIARFCHSVAPQLEILRLRGEVARGASLSTAVRRFSESLKRLDTDDLWLNLTQNVAEMLRAERASLLIYDEADESFKIRALIGAKGTPVAGEEVGGRVARIVFSKNDPVAVSEVSKTGLPPAPADRQYKTTSFLSCPIAISGHNIGVMNFTDQTCGKPFGKNSLELFQAIAPQLAVAIDRAMLKEKAGEFEQLSVTDPLTGLLNRRYIEERLMEEVKRSTRHGFPMSFMMLDVDHFKSYNDAYGHPAGDEALKLVGHVIRETLRGADVAARFGGEEFSILLPQTTSEEAAAIAERIRSNIETANFQYRRVTASIGIASCSAELCVSTDVVAAADKALYEAKNTGRNRVLSFEEISG